MLLSQQRHGQQRMMQRRVALVLLQQGLVYQTRILP
jgi:hypothetical protein